jgi:hypothetical protein
MELSPSELNDLMKRFPNFELSYETVSHKKVSPVYNICLAIPQGKKCYAWFTFIGEKDCCILLELNREKKICKGTIIDIDFNNKLELGTLLYGTIIENENDEHSFFVIEDLIQFKGIPFKKSNLQEKLGFINEFMKSTQQIFKTKQSIVFALPVMWDVQSPTEFDCATTLPEDITKKIPYVTHHIQYRCFTEIKPYLNSVITKKLNFAAVVVQENKKVSNYIFDTIPIKMDFTKPQYRYPTVFQVTADIQFDIYHMFAFGKNSKPVYYNIAYIPNYKTSVFMNSLFRKIKENSNLDLIEESDDEEEFQNMEEDKYVDIDKVLSIEFTFNPKFKKWVPMRVVYNSIKIVHISKLTQDVNDRPQYDNNNGYNNFNNNRGYNNGYHKNTNGSNNNYNSNYKSNNKTNNYSNSYNGNNNNIRKY